MIDQTQPRRLYRSRTNVMLAGVAGGLAEYFNIDPTLVRVLLFLALLPAGPFGLIIYFVLAMIIPQAPVDEPQA
jgi:phage shock protein C